MMSPTGVPNLRSPEILNGEGYTEKTDLWVVGIIFY